LGEQRLKNVAVPVRAYRVVTGPDGSGRVRADAPEPMFDRPAVAVLPFLNISGEPNQDYFSDGLTEDLITALAAWR